MTEAYEADPADVEALVADALVAANEETDPVLRDIILAGQRELFYAAARRIAAERARNAATMHDSGMSYAKIGEALNLTRARAQQLVEAGR